jgi:hypothetical protein
VVVVVEMVVVVEVAGLDVAVKNAITQLLDHNDGYVRNENFVYFIIFFSFNNFFPYCTCSHSSWCGNVLS